MTDQNGGHETVRELGPVWVGMDLDPVTLSHAGAMVEEESTAHDELGALDTELMHDANMEWQTSRGARVTRVLRSMGRVPQAKTSTPYRRAKAAEEEGGKKGFVGRHLPSRYPKQWKQLAQVDPDLV
jgi:hypothetical protein